MSRYTAQVLKSVTSTTVGVGALTTSNTQRLRLQEVIVGSDAATLGTSNFRFEVQRSTTNPTGTSITPQPLDLADASTATVFSNLSANGTLVSGAVLLTIPLNEQATFRWIAVPGSEIIIPGTANSGAHLMTPVCGNTPSAAATLFWE